MELSFEKLKRPIFLYLALPNLIFLAGFLKPWLGIPAAVLVGLGGWLCCRDRRQGDRVVLDRRLFWLLLAAVILWCYLGGQGGLYYQSADWRYRNAVFRDLITHSWPVQYPNYGRALVYYLGHWLPAALVGKGAAALFGAAAGWTIANLALWAWTALGVFLVLLLLLVTVKAVNGRQQLLALLLLVFFSGLDLLGWAVTRTPLEHQLEWWAGYYYQYSSFTTCLFWVFNQAVAPWLATLVLLNERTVRSYAWLGFSVLLCGPMPFVGLVLYMACFALRDLGLSVRQGQLPAFLRQVFTPQNLIALIALFPPVGLYLLSSSAGSSMGLALANGSLAETLRYYPIFLFFEVGIYLLLLWRDHRRSLLFYATAAILLLCPLIRVGGFSDFCMRGSIPALLVLLVLVLRWLLDHKADFFCRSRRQKLHAWVLAACLAIGAVTPAVEFVRTAHGVWWHKSLLVLCDDIVTWDQDFDAEDAQSDGKYYLDNFSCYSLEDNIFYRYFAK